MRTRSKSVRSMLGLIAACISLSSCTDRRTDVVHIAWVHQFRCLGGLDSTKQYQTCSGENESSSVIEFHLYPSQRFALAKVIKQDPKNFSVDLFQIKDCDIYDAMTWSCTTTFGSSGALSYFVRNGNFVYEFSGGEKPLTYTGKLHEGQASWWKLEFYD